MRAKFRVSRLSKYIGSKPKAGGGWDEAILDSVELGAVTGQSGENQQFFLATPVGRIELSVTNPDAVGFFQPGKSYYVDFTPADAPEEGKS